MTNSVNVPALAHSIHPSVQLIEGRAVTSSVEVARVYGKQHKRVLAAIERLRPELTNIQQGYFQPIDHGSAYRLTRDGFTLLVLSFSGKRARAFKQAYLEAFNALEGALLHSTRTLPPLQAMSHDPGLEEAARFFSQMQTAMNHTLLKALMNEVTTGDKRWRKQRGLRQLVSTAVA